MRVLFQNHDKSLGANGDERVGGDTTQMLQTKRQLERLGCHVDIDVTSSPDISGYDLVHVFNIQTSESSIKQIHNAKRSGKPVVLSTIFWDMRHTGPIVAKISPIYRHRPARLLGKIHWTIPYYLSILKGYPLQRRKYRLARECLELADLLLPNSYAELENVALLFDAPWVRSKSVVVPNAVEVIDPIENNDADHLISDLPPEFVLQVAQMGVEKCQLQVINALMDTDLPLVFIGPRLDEPYGEKCVKAADRRGNTYLLGKISHSSLGSFYKRAKVHVLPSLRESPGLATLEAAIRGANCVVSLHGPVNEYFGDKVWYCDPLNLRSIREAILTAWKEPRQSALAEYLKANFTWDIAARITLSAYKKVLNKDVRAANCVSSIEK